MQNKKMNEENYKSILTRFIVASFGIGFLFGVVVSSLVVRGL